MPPPISAQLDDGRELVRLEDHDQDRHGIDIGHADLTRLGPGLTGVGVKIFHSPSAAFSPSSDTNNKDTRSISEFRLPRPQHNATYSITSTESDADAEAIELAAFHSSRRTDRAQSFVGYSGYSASHGRFDSAASSSTSTSSGSVFASEDEYIYGDADAIGARPAARTSLELADTHPRPAQSLPRPADSQNVQVEEGLDNRLSHESNPPLTPMSPRQTRVPQRIYVPEPTHHHDSVQILPNNDFSEVDINAPSAPSPVRHSPDSEHNSEHTLAIETDTLLPVQKSLSPTGLPLPATSPTCDEPSTFRFSYSLFETIFHLFGFSVTTVLVVLSVWLTLANVVM